MIKKPQGWMLNGQLPTNKSEKQEWNGIERDVTIWKYTFLKGLDFANKIIVHDTSEAGAWRQLREMV